MRVLTLTIALLLSAWPAMAQYEEPPELTLEELRAKWGDDGSRYVDVDGVEVHYRDEGEGPVVLLLHASYFNLMTWDHLAEALMPDYRVIRLDFPNMGLSSSETKAPAEGRINLIERNVEIVEGFVEALRLERFALIATSSGGSAGFRYASYHPDDVSRLILINSAGMPRTAQTDPNRERSDVARWQAMRVKPRAFWEYSVSRNYPSLEQAPDAILDQAFDLNRRVPADPVAPYYFETGDTQGILSAIKAPAMILWGKANPTVMHLEADVFSHWMTGAPTIVKKYEGLGHYPYVEAPELVSADVRAFLAGDFDDDLRRTQRVKAEF